MTFTEKITDLLKKNAFPVLLVLIVLAVLFPALNNGFVDWDDVQYVVSNRALRGSWLDVLTFFPGYYHPLTVLTYKLEFSLFGLQPLPYHLTNLLLHAACCVAVYRFLSALGARPPSAFLAALLFAVHPVHAEPAAWISGRKELLWGLFAFWSLTCYLRFLDGRCGRFLRWSLFFFLLAALAKPAALVLPLALPLLDYYRGRRFSPGLLAEKAPYLLLALPLLALSGSPEGFLLGGGAGAFSFAGAAASAARSALFYLGKLAVPVSLSALYPALTLPFGAGWYLLLFLAGCAALGLLLRPAGRAGAPGPGWRKKTAFAVLFFFITALPGLIVSPPADRYAYVPAAGLFFLYGELVVHLFSLASRRARLLAPALALLVAAHCFALAGASFYRAPLWKDSLTLWTGVMERNALEPMAYYGRGNAYRAAGCYAAALADFTRCLEIDPGNWKALSNRGRIYAELKRPGPALADYSAAIALSPSSAQLFLNRGNAYLLGGDRALAVKDYDRALALAPGLAQAEASRRAALAPRAGSKPAGR